MGSFNMQLLVQAFGLVFIGLGVAARLGFWKSWYWQSRGTAYGYIPLGGLFIFYTFLDPLKKTLGSYAWLFPVIFALVLSVGVWWTIRPPLIVKPTWVRWVEKHPTYIIDAMKSAANKDKEWGRYVASEEAVDTWARSLKAPKERNKKGNAKGAR
jgi:hypothetical protein